MSVAKFEVVLPVDNYLEVREEDGGDTDEAFELASEDLDSVYLEAREEMMEFLTDAQMAQVKINTPTFLEFDSSNVSHAGAYFEVEIEAPESVIAALTGEDKLIQPVED